MPRSGLMTRSAGFPVPAQRDSHVDSRSTPGGRVYLEAAPDLPGPLAHDAEAKPSLLTSAARSRGVEPSTVVLHRHMKTIQVHFEFDAHVLGSSVLSDVAQGLLDDAQQLGLSRGIDHAAPEFTGNGEVHMDSALPLKTPEELLQGGHKLARGRDSPSRASNLVPLVVPKITRRPCKRRRA